VGLDGSSPREVLTDLGHDIGVVFATWHPDGKRITAWTNEAGDPFPVTSTATPNFLTEPVDGGPAIRSTFPKEVQKEIDPAGDGPILDELRMDFKFAWAPSGKAVLFERAFHGVRNIWRMTVDPATLQPTKVERLTTSPGIDAELSISHDGSRLAFTAEHHQLRVWTYPFDANYGRIMGAGEPVTNPEIEVWAVNLSRDGKKLAVKGNRDGRVRIWGVSLPNGREEPFLPDDSYFRDTPIWSPDGRRAAYLRTSSSNKCQFVVWSSENRTEEPVTAEGPDGGWVYDWSPDGKFLLLTGGEDQQIWQLPVDPSSLGQSAARKIIADLNSELFQAHFSSDGKWIVFGAIKNVPHRTAATVYVMPSKGGPWIPITDGKQWDDKSRWSPDGKTIYFLSERRGFFNLWGAHFDPVKGRPQGEPFQVTSFETSTLMIPKDIPPVDISLTDRRLALPLAQTSGNIWILDNVDH
jgi:Tol biopolymer transport system component